MGALPEPVKGLPAFRDKFEEKHEGYIRKHITYTADEGDHVPAYLLIPTGYEGKRPAMLCLHQTVAIGKGQPAGLDKDANKHYALELVKRGYVCLVPDYPSFGDYKYDFAKSPHASGTMKAIWNNVRGLDLLAAMPEVDSERIGAIGHSLGGHNAMFTAAFDTRIKVVVSCCGFCSFAKYKGGDLKGWSGERYMPRIGKDFGNDPKKMPFEFADVISSFAPRAFLAIAPIRDDNFAVDGVRDAMKGAEQAYAKVPKELQARYPDAGHDFPPEEREAAYRFLDERLKPGAKK